MVKVAIWKFSSCSPSMLLDREKLYSVVRISCFFVFEVWGRNFAETICENHDQKQRDRERAPERKKVNCVLNKHS